MDSNLNRNSRIAMLMVALSLIGGTGCVHYLMASSSSGSRNNTNPVSVPRELTAQEKEEIAKKAELAREESRRKYELEYNNLVIAANANDPAAKTKLGIEYLKNIGYFPKDVKKGIALIKSAADDGHPDAEYYYGWLLLKGTPVESDYQIKLEQGDIELSYSEGIRLIENSAKKICAASFSRNWNYPAQDLKNIYLDGKYVLRNEQISDLWFARFILHCGGQSGFSSKGKWRLFGHEYFSDAKTLAFLYLLDNSRSPLPKYYRERASAFAATLNSEQIKEAKAIAQELRLAVRQSEQEYPDPTNYKGKK
ncbi:tetratricopeptide repeat protein [Undibacterium pigrum]|uniref:Sel1 repeat-containing protein n=1 Tax=Undibacterium pigrum TaxID=401470 RepID=A0A318IZC2_9BURK|nr:sel1 repeat family protein [Undibacterium pigrum]PXX40283.1 hypothetical protein DFR42_108117 [Undibacterium pigrum]